VFFRDVSTGAQHSKRNELTGVIPKKLPDADSEKGLMRSTLGPCAAQTRRGTAGRGPPAAAGRVQRRARSGSVGKTTGKGRRWPHPEAGIDRQLWKHIGSTWSAALRRLALGFGAIGNAGDWRARSASARSSRVARLAVTSQEPEGEPQSTPGTTCGAKDTESERRGFGSAVPERTASQADERKTNVGQRRGWGTTSCLKFVRPIG
jgi:hypothetical protein